MYFVEDTVSNIVYMLTGISQPSSHALNQVRHEPENTSAPTNQLGDVAGVSKRRTLRRRNLAIAVTIFFLRELDEVESGLVQSGAQVRLWRNIIANQLFRPSTGEVAL